MGYLDSLPQSILQGVVFKIVRNKNTIDNQILLIFDIHKFGLPNFYKTSKVSSKKKTNIFALPSRPRPRILDVLTSDYKKFNFSKI